MITLTTSAKVPPGAEGGEERKRGGEEKKGREKHINRTNLDNPKKYWYIRTLVRKATDANRIFIYQGAEPTNQMLKKITVKNFQVEEIYPAIFPP